MIVGVLGGGQLARMLALAGLPLGLRFRFLDPAVDACAGTLGEHLCAQFDDRAALEQLARDADLVTYEFENVPPDAVRFLSEGVPVHPSGEALAVARDRLREKTLFRELGIPTADFVAVDSQADLQQAVATLGLPALIKTRTLGYDGKGQYLLREPTDLESAWEALAGAPALIETLVPFDRELSIIAVRVRSGATSFYPLSENRHRDGILHLAASRPGDPMQSQGEEWVRRLLDTLDYVGVLAVEFFEQDGQLLANEMAPRVHNSAHWTIEGAETSQFENHLRAVLDLPLGATGPLGRAAMVNFVGELPPLTQVLEVPQAHLHLYDKAPRPGRKLGHATVRADDQRTLDRLLARLESVQR